MKYTTGLSFGQFAVLVEELLVHFPSWDRGLGRPRSLPFARVVKMCVMYYRLNLSQLVLAELFGVSQSFVSKHLSLLESPMSEVLGRFVPDEGELLRCDSSLIVDGTLIPCPVRDRGLKMFSGKHRKTGFNHQIVTGLNGQVLWISDGVKGCMHDAKAFRELGLDSIINPGFMIGDRGYQGLGIITPHKRPVGGELCAWQIEFNRVLNGLRCAVERAIAGLKQWKILATRYRRPLRTYPQAFKTVRALYFYEKSLE